MGIRFVRWVRVPELTEREPFGRESWGEGPWQDEPDLVEWRRPGSSLPRLAVRGGMGAWCGYVGVPEGHPLYGANPHEVELEAHGGVNYGDHCAGAVCHVPEPGEAGEVYWLGFDCGHFMDISPRLDATTRHVMAGYRAAGLLGREALGTYKTVSYVVHEVERLAEQLETKVIDEIAH